jgi:multicomponent Na+:H+ antiporter subunit E
MDNFATDRSVIPAAIARFAIFLAFWTIIAGVKSTDLIVGLLASIAATGTSLKLLPPGQWHLSPGALAKLVFRFLYQSVVAGFDVAWRALDPRMPLRPGFVRYRPQLPPGAARNAFCTITSLLPGTLPCGSDQDGCLMVHCLDTGQRIVEHLTEEESLLIEVIGGRRDD